MAALEDNIFADNQTLITYKDIKDTLKLFIVRNCKNIEQYRNDIPPHFDNDKRILYSYVVTPSNVLLNKYEIVTNCLTLTYSKNNTLFNTISLKIIEKNIDKIFQYNNIFESDDSKQIATINDIIKICFISLELLTKKVLRVYFPLTDDYYYFYSGNSTSSDLMSYKVSNIDITAKNNIKRMFQTYMKYLTGCDQYTKYNLLYSFLYNVQINKCNYDQLATGKSEYIFNNNYQNFHINIT